MSKKNDQSGLLLAGAQDMLTNAINGVIASGLNIREKLRAFQSILDLPPHPTFVEMHPQIKNHWYVPIGRVETLLKLIFTRYRVEVTHQSAIFNGVQVGIRLHYQCPITDEWHFQDGVAAKELQTASGTGALKLDFSNINRSAIDMALPIAKSIAIKDAADHIGKIFGSDIMRSKDLFLEQKSAFIEKWMGLTPQIFNQYIAASSVVDRILGNAQSIEKFDDALVEISGFLAKMGVVASVFQRKVDARRDELIELQKKQQLILPQSQSVDIGALSEGEISKIELKEMLKEGDKLFRDE